MTILDPFGDPWAPFGHHFAIKWVTDAHRWTLEGPRVDFQWFFIDFERQFCITFWYVLSFEASRSMFGWHVWCLMIFEWNICWFLISQPIKSIVNSSVFNRFHFLDFFMNLMISGTCLDLILITLQGLGAPIWWFVGLLYRHWNFNEFLRSLLASQNKGTWSFQG